MVDLTADSDSDDDGFNEDLQCYETFEVPAEDPLVPPIRYHPDVDSDAETIMYDGDAETIMYDGDSDNDDDSDGGDTVVLEEVDNDQQMIAPEA